jgi:hypothetical protein
MTASTLRSYTLKDLAKLARRRGVNGWQAMRKDQLVRAILRNGSSHGATSRTGKPKSSPAKAVKKPAAPVRRTARSKPAPAVRKAPLPTPAQRLAARRLEASRVAKKSRVLQKIEQAKVRISRSKNLAFESVNGHANGSAKDRLIVMVRGPYWLHAYWELTPQGIARAQAALGQEWHQAQPLLRVLTVTTHGSTTTSERISREISIHGGVKNWYIDVQEPNQTYRLEIGYRAASGKFFSLARSNVVSTPSGGSSDSLDVHWNDVLADCDKIYAMSGGFSTEGASELQDLFEERLRRPMGPANSSRFGAGLEGLLPHDRHLKFQVEAEVVIHGTTHPDAKVVLQGEPLKLRPDGTFSVRLDMPNRRQVIPIVASTKDGVEQRTIVLAVERNTKIMEPLTRESGE